MGTDNQKTRIHAVYVEILQKQFQNMKLFKEISPFHSNWMTDN